MLTNHNSRGGACHDNRNENGAGDIATVTVLGTGVLGSPIAYQTAHSGFEVTAYDISDDILASAKLRFQELAARYERRWTARAGNVRGPRSLGSLTLLI